jgi:hypothetical protein
MVVAVVAVVIVIASRPYVRLSRGGGEATVAVVVVAVAVAMISFVLSAMPLIYGLPGVSVSIMRSL